MKSRVLSISRLVTWCAWLYVVLCVLVWCLISVAGDSWWLATVLLYGPRWVMLVPVMLMALAAVVFSRRSLVPLSLAAILIAWPIMGLTVHLKQPQKTDGPILRVLSYNVHEGHINTELFVRFLKENSVDLVALQEQSHDKPLPRPQGWYEYHDNGLAVLSRYPLQFVKLVQVLPPGEKWPGTTLLHTTVTTPHGKVAFCSLQLPSPRFGLLSLADKHTVFRPSRNNTLEKQTRERWLLSQETARYIAQISIPALVVGDFNTTPDSPLFRDVWSGAVNAFSVAGSGYGWTQRVAVHGLPFGARIDHILTRNGLQPLMCEVGPDFGSDHLPLIADIQFNKPANSK